MDRAVQRTDNDAMGSKLWAVHKGYYNDPYLGLLATRAPESRFPLISIGTYCRVLAVDRLVERFLEQTNGCEQRAIVSLGAGSDSRPFNMLAGDPPSGLVYHEVDFPVMTQRKARQIRRNQQLRTAIHLPDSEIDDNTSVSTACYRLHGVDLRKLAEYSGLGLVKGAPTLVISECCLCYLKPAESQQVLGYFVQTVGVPALAVALYEPIGLDDEFGRVMAENLALRGLSLPSFQLYSSEAAQEHRLSDLGLSIGGGAVSIKDVYTAWLTTEDRERIARLEFLDEVEEMYLLLRHYCVAWGAGFNW